MKEESKKKVGDAALESDELRKIICLVVGK